VQESEWEASRGITNKARKTEKGYKIRWLKFTNKLKERGTKKMIMLDSHSKTL